MILFIQINFIQIDFNKIDLNEKYQRRNVMFIGRTRELNTLKQTYDKTGFGMTVIYGR